jgi:tripartite ATP-independent transporter DctP family solute receptor
MPESTVTRRHFNTRLITAGGLLILSRRARATDFSMRQYHNQPVESPLHKRLVEMWAAVKAETGGRVQVETFPLSNQANDPSGNPTAMLLSGELEFLTQSGNGLASQVPAADAQATPYAFRTQAQVYRALDGELGVYLGEELKAKGLHLVPGGCFENGFHQITCATRPVRAAADMQGLKIRVPGSKLYQDFFTSLGAVVSTMNINNLYAALKSGVVEAQEDPLDVAELFKLYEVQKYMSMTDHSWSGYNLVASLKVWQRLPTDVQRVIERNGRKFARLQREDTVKLNGQLRAELTHRGMTFNDPDTASFRAGLGPPSTRTRS